MGTNLQGGFFMKIITQLGLVFGICLVSEWISTLLPFAFPGSIIGMLLLLLLLAFHLVRQEHLQETSDFLLGNLPFFFLPAAVSIINYLDLLQANLVAIAVVIVVSLVLTFTATVYTVRLVTWLVEGRKGK